MNKYVDIGFYSAIKKNGVLSMIRKEINQEIMLLRKTSQIQKDKYHIISLICISQLNISSYTYVRHKIEGELHEI